MENIENVEKRGGRLSVVGCRLSFPLFECATRDHEPGVRASRTARLSRPPSSRGMKPIGFAPAPSPSAATPPGVAPAHPTRKPACGGTRKLASRPSMARKGSRGVLGSTATPAHHCADSASRHPHRVNVSKRNRRGRSLWATLICQPQSRVQR